MTRQTMGTIMLSAMVKRRARGERQAEEINWRKMLRIRKWKVLARSLLATHNVVRHTYEFRRKIKFYPNLFIYGTYNSQLTVSLQPIFHTFLKRAKTKRKWMEEAKPTTHNLIYLIKEMELGNINSPFTSTKVFLFVFLLGTEIYAPFLRAYVAPPTRTKVCLQPDKSNWLKWDLMKLNYHKVSIKLNCENLIQTRECS